MHKSIPRIISLLFLIFMISCSVSLSAQSPLADRIVVIDPGHGGTYPGAVQNDVREADVNLAVSLRLYDELTHAGIQVILTRSADMNVTTLDVPLAAELQARIDMAQYANADIFVSLHANSDPDSSTTSGVISFYGAGRPSDLATAIHHFLILRTKAVDGGIRPANFYVLRNSEPPAVLIEMGFLTNTSEARLLTDPIYQATIAKGIAEGIIKYFLNRNLN